MNIEKMLSVAMSFDQSNPDVRYIVDELKNEVLSKKAKTGGTANVLSVAKEIVKASKYNAIMNGEIKETDDVTGTAHYYFTDGHYFMETAESTGLDAPDKNDLCDGGENSKMFVKMVKDTLDEISDGPIAELPESFIEEVKVKKHGMSKDDRLIYVFENGYAVNAEYLVKAIRATGKRTVWIPKNPKTFCAIRGEKASFYMLPFNNTDLNVGFNVKRG